MRGTNLKLIDEELKIMEKEATIESNKRSMGSVLMDPLLRLPLILTCFMQIGQQLSGIGAVRTFVLNKLEVNMVTRVVIVIVGLLLCSSTV